LNVAGTDGSPTGSDPRGGDIQIRHGRGAAPVPLTNEPVPALFSPV